MTHIVPFIKYFAEESLRNRSLSELYDADFNKASFELTNESVDIAPRAIRQGSAVFSYINPQVLYVYPSKEDSEDYLLKSEQLVEACHGISSQAIFEIRGNKEQVCCSYYAEEEDIAIIESAVRNFFPNSYTERGEATPMTGEYFVYDFLPDEAFYMALTPHETFTVSPLNLNVQTLLNLQSGEGVFQVVIRPLPELHNLVKEAVDCNWQAKLGADNRVTPSLQAGSINKKLEYKSPEFRSYYSVCIRMILPTDTLTANVKAFISNYLYGLKAFKILDNNYYTKSQILSMLNERASYHTGFLCNSQELTSLLHVPFQILDDRELANQFASTPPGDKPIKTGEYKDIIIGNWACGNSSKEIHLPIQKEIPHIHVLGVSRSGKSILQGYMAIEKLKKGEAAFVFDPHGDLVDNILKMVPRELMDKVIVIDFGLEDLTPQITIRANVDLSVPSKVSDDLTESIRDATGSREKFWGPRMAYVFSCLYFIYCVIPEMNLVHLRQMIPPKSQRGKVIRAKVKARIKHPIVRDFIDELEFTSQEILMPVITRLSHLLLDEKSLRLFTLNENKISISDIMNNGMLCLVNLSIGTIGRQRSSILSGLMESLIVNNALSRANIPYDERKPCTLIKDEFYLGPGDLHMQLSTLAKYNISTIFAHQFLDQVEGVTREVMATAGTRIAFKLRRKDAENFGRDFGIAPEEFTSLKQFEAIVKIEDEVVKINTPRPSFQNEDLSAEILKNCYKKYYLSHKDSKPDKKEKKLLYDTL